MTVTIDPPTTLGDALPREMARARAMPVQRPWIPRHEQATVPEPVYMAAYAVYCHVFSPQPALVTGDCRGGFSAGDLIAFLYAKTFPETQWKVRVDEAFRGMAHL